jgi:hypothetical protein
MASTGGDYNRTASYEPLIYRSETNISVFVMRCDFAQMAIASVAEPLAANQRFLHPLDERRVTADLPFEN